MTHPTEDLSCVPLQSSPTVPSTTPYPCPGGFSAAPGAKTDDDDTGRETLIRELLAGVYHPVRIVLSTPARAGRATVTVDIADELRRRYAEFGEVSASVRQHGRAALAEFSKLIGEKPSVT